MPELGSDLLFGCFSWKQGESHISELLAFTDKQVPGTYAMFPVAYLMLDQNSKILSV